MRKVRGYPWPGVVVSRFTTTAGELRFVVECTARACKGALHIFNQDQLKVVDGNTNLAKGTSWPKPSDIAARLPGRARPQVEAIHAQAQAGRRSATTERPRKNVPAAKGRKQ